MRTLFKESYSKPSNLRKAVIAVEPYLLNPRISVQQGLFLTPLTLDYSFEECLYNTLEIHSTNLPENLEITFDGKDKDLDLILNRYHSDGILKIIIEKKCHQSALLDLNKMNINSSSLFPGFEGFIKSLGYLIKKEESDKEIEETQTRLLNSALEVFVAQMAENHGDN